MKSAKPILLLLSLLMIASLVFAPQAHAGDLYLGAALNRSYVNEQVDADGVDVRRLDDLDLATLGLGIRFQF